MNRDRERESYKGYLSNEVRRRDEALGAPKRVVEVGAVAFELGGEAAVNNGVTAALLEEISHK